MCAKFTWKTKDRPDKTSVQSLRETFGLDETVAQLLVTRGIDEPKKYENFIHPDLQNLHDPKQLFDMKPGIDRIKQGILANEKMVIYGDYDVDGLTSTAIMKEAIESIGGEVETYIPNRFDDGYGPNLQVYKYFVKQGYQLIITVDNGVAGNEAVAYAMTHGVDVVITDHHELPKVLPEATAIIHPRHPEGNYPFGDLSGAGVAFKVACALLEEVPTDLLDLAALGTVADLVSLTDENRIIVANGLKVLQHTERMGLQSLYRTAGIKPEQINETTIGFMIGPRLNAIGRMGDANPGVDLLTTLDPDYADELAKQLEQTNQERQKLVQKITQAALKTAQAPENQTAKTLVITGENWHEGVLGIVASHIVETTGKPALILNLNPTTNIAKGSGRSVAGFDLFASINQNRQLTENFGGHQMAVGLTIKQENIATIHRGMETYATNNNFHVQTAPVKYVDLVLSLADCNMTFFTALQTLAPFGTNNPEPLIAIDRVHFSQLKTMGQNQQHMRLQLSDQNKKLTAVCFNAPTLIASAQKQSGAINVLGTLSLNEFRGQKNLQLLLQDIQFNQTTMSSEPTANDIKPHKAVEHQPKILVTKQTKLTAGLFSAPDLYVFFRKHYLKRSQKFIHSIDRQVAFFTDQLVTKATSITIIDQPETLAQLSFLLSQQHANKLRFTFFNAQPTNFQLPNRQKFSRVLNYVRSHSSLPVMQQQKMAAYLQVSDLELRFILKVFSQLGFVKIEDGALSISSHLKKHQLTEAPVYQSMVQRLQIEQQIDRQTNQELLHWINQLVSENKQD
ncbi:single-stranded-DNA-specific exonuclease RecJ [Lactobacillus sp. CC-MHH1034]|uniref:single-stranded-DNA-specific exonuclease RecJ n=1 Tax=Agrilactobacillus fermenti TaxID=2586909 RepID=UPI001E3E4A18|nr:single-stranded-DNA-specific exonuclease RecJ [Agrilactobacillus fermenti]MCD2257361.1 single-stranded-DNA-specific exonuclease RecJ [Agrilactobacillus fermenti]